MTNVVRLCLLSVLLAHAVTARAAECLGVTLADTYQLEGETLLLNGLGARLATMLKVKVYVAGLYLKQQSTDAAAIIHTDQPRHLVLRFVRDVSRKEITDGWTEGFKTNRANMQGLATRITALNDAMVDLSSGSELVFSYAPEGGTTVSIGNDQKTVIQGADFASAFISIWLGKPPNKEVKTGMLGGECD